MALVWLLGVVPAAVVTVLRGRWLLFFCGWLTGGILWFIGALIPDPDASERDRHLAGIATATAAVALIVLGLFGARPAPLLGMNGKVLQNTVGGVDILSFAEGDCRRRDGDWICRVYDSQLSGSVDYRVKVRWTGCWNATRVGSPGGSSPKRLSGCANLVHFVFD